MGSQSFSQVFSPSSGAGISLCGSSEFLGSNSSILAKFALKALLGFSGMGFREEGSAGGAFLAGKSQFWV